MRLAVLAISSLLSVRALTAEVRQVNLVGRSEVIVTTPKITLGDIADVSSNGAQNDEAVIALKKVALEQSPLPGQETTLTAYFILERMRSQGVDLAKVGYTLPRVISVKRAARSIHESEIRGVLEEYFRENNREVNLNGIELPSTHSVFPGDLSFTVTSVEGPERGKLSAAFVVRSMDNESMPLIVKASGDEFKELPVAKHPLPRGAVVSEEDIVMARLNTSKLPKGGAQSRESIVGFETVRSIREGDFFDTSALKIPPLVAAGSSVALRYQTSLFEATAIGTALDSGMKGDEVRVKNDQSQKIVKGKVLDKGLVGVK